jgi:hypothetical protein
MMRVRMYYDRFVSHCKLLWGRRGSHDPRIRPEIEQPLVSLQLDGFGQLS